MRIFLTCIFLSIAISALACSGMQKSFCMVKSLRGGDNVICGVVSAKSGHSVQINVIEVFFGIETRSVITIWDGTDFNCSGIISMKAGDMGAIGDTLIAILPIINSVPQNTWDVVGDYRRPYSLYETAWLNVVNGSVNGYISGAPNAPILIYAYSGFKNYWINHSNDCLTLNVRETISERLKFIHLNDHIIINSLSEECFSVKLYATDGRLLKEFPFIKQHNIKCYDLPRGVYSFLISNNKGEFLTKKIILW